MSTIFTEIGVQLPFIRNFGRGATVIHVKPHASIDYSAGDIIKLVPGSSSATTLAAFDPDALDDFSIATPEAAAATDAASAVIGQIYGVCLEDIVQSDDGGTGGMVMLRGHCMAFCDVVTSIGLDYGLWCGSGATDPVNKTLAGIADITPNFSVKVIARFRATSLASGAGTVLRPVLFNGVEGFGSIQGL